MKRLNLLINVPFVAAILYHTPLIAQCPTDSLSHYQIDTLRVSSSLGLSKTKSGFKTTADKKLRIVATSNYVYQSGAYQLEDTANYAYSSGRYFDPEFNPLDPEPYNYLSTYNYDKSTQVLSLTSGVDRQDIITIAYNSAHLPIRRVSTQYSFASPFRWYETDYEYTPELWEKSSQHLTKRPAYTTGFRTNYTHDLRGNIVQSEGYEWDDLAKKWQNRYKMIQNFDTSKMGISLLTLRQAHVWRPLLSAFRPSEQEMFRYNAADEVEESIYQQWDSVLSQWYNVSRNTYLYDIKGQLEYQVSYQWNKSKLLWDTTKLTQQTFDALGNIIIHQTRSMVKDTLRNNTLNEYVYSGSQLQSYIQMEWKNFKNRYDTIRIYQAHYDSKNRMIEQYHIDFPNVKDGGFIIYGKSLRRLYAYDAMDNTISCERFDLDGSGTWQPSSKAHYYYTIIDPTLVSDKAKTDNHFQVYPNPNEGSFVLQQKEPVSQDVSIKVYDALGRMLYSAVHVFQNGKTQLRLSNCVPGVYLVCIGDAGVQNPCIRFTIK